VSVGLGQKKLGRSSKTSEVVGEKSNFPWLCFFLTGRGVEVVCGFSGWGPQKGTRRGYAEGGHAGLYIGGEFLPLLGGRVVPRPSFYVVMVGGGGGLIFFGQWARNGLFFCGGVGFLGGVWGFVDSIASFWWVVTYKIRLGDRDCPFQRKTKKGGSERRKRIQGSGTQK